MLWKLNKCVYGLNEASRNWYNRVKDELIKAGMQKSKYDDAPFYYKSKDACQGIQVVHVDDFQYSGSAEFEKIIDHLYMIHLQ